jgi:hypothetical protein
MNPRGQLMRQGTSSYTMFFTLFGTSLATTTFDYAKHHTTTIIVRPDQQQDGTRRASHENGQAQGYNWYDSLVTRRHFL